MVRAARPSSHHARQLRIQRLADILEKRQKLIIISRSFLHNRTDKHGLNRTIQQDGKHDYLRVAGRRRPEKLLDDYGDLRLRNRQRPVCRIGDSDLSQQVIGSTNG